MSQPQLEERLCLLSFFPDLIFSLVKDMPPQHSWVFCPLLLIMNILATKTSTNLGVTSPSSKCSEKLECPAVEAAGSFVPLRCSKDARSISVLTDGLCWSVVLTEM